MRNRLLVFGLGLIVASVGWAALFYKSIGTVTLDPLDVVTTLLAFVSLAANVVQWRESRALLIPVRNPLIGLFNELKARQQRVWSKQNRIREGTTPLEFYDFTDEVLQGFEQLREHVISLIETVAPGMPDEDFFRASIRGLTADEKRMRSEWMEHRRREENRKAATEWQPSRTMFRRYEGKREAVIVRGFEKGFEWTLEDKENKTVIDEGAADTLEQAKAQADAAAKAKPESPWRSR